MFAILNSIWQSSWGIGLSGVRRNKRYPIPRQTDSLDVIAFMHDIE